MVRLAITLSCAAGMALALALLLVKTEKPVHDPRCLNNEELKF